MPEAVSARVEWLELPTYVTGPDSPYPVIGWTTWRQHYPYSTKLDLSTEARPVKHRAVVLENRYVRITVLPDLGGKIFSLYDKTAGHDAFMVPPTIKFQNVALRGAWLAGGIELNFGSTHHTAHTVSPVTWAVRQDADGGASVWVGSITRPVEARYAVRVRLGPDRAAMDLEILTMGPPTIAGMMYWWTNSAVDVTQDSRLFYFGKYADSGHGRHSYPVCDGMDYSWYRHRATGSDMFLMEAQRDYLGFYDYGRHHGVANAADRFQVPGQKYFTWGNDQRGRYWDLMLSDAEQTYCEIQRGRLPSQGMTEAIPPMAAETWMETWMPISGTEGFSGMENGLVLSVVTEGSQAVLRLVSAEPVSDLALQAACGNAVLGEFRIAHLEPGKVFSARAALKKGQRCDRVKVTGADGKVWMNWQEFVPEDKDWFSIAGHRRQRGHEQKASPEELYLEAERNRVRSWPHPNRYADDLLDQVLKDDPGHTGALQAKAEQENYAGRFEQAIEHIRKALERKPYDPPLQALLGWTLLRLRRPDEAVEPFSKAARYEQYRKNGLAGLVFVHLMARRWDEALGAADRLLDERTHDRWGRLLKVMVLRKLRRTDQAAEILRGLLAQDPLWCRLHAEALLLGVDVDLAGGKRKLGDDSVAAALPYIGLGLWEDAETLLRLTESNEPFSPAVRLAHLAYVRHQLGDRQGVERALKDLRAGPPEQANPWAIGSIPVLDEMVQLFPDEPMLHLLRGNLLSSRWRIEESGAGWQKAADLGLQHTVVHRNLGVYAAYKGDKEAALRHYRKAWELSGFDLNCYSEYDRLLMDMGRHEERLAVYEQLPPRLRRRSMVAMRRVLQLLDTSRYDEALTELDARQFLSGEFERTIRFNFVEALVGRACRQFQAGRLDRAIETISRGLTYPRNMNVGRSDVFPDEAIVQYLLGLFHEAAGDNQAARRHWFEAATEGHGVGEIDQAYEMLAWAALGKKHKALRMAHRIETLARKEEPPPPDAHWWYTHETIVLSHGLGQILKGRIDEARGIWEKLLAEQPSTRWVRMHLDMPRAVLERIARQVTGPLKAPAASRAHGVKAAPKTKPPRRAPRKRARSGAKK